MKIEGIPKRFQDKTLENFDRTGQEASVQQSIATIAEGRSLVLTGKTGSGKSHLATGLLKLRAAQLDAQEIWPERALFLPAVEFFVRLKGSFGDSETTEAGILDDCEKANICVIDDIGAEKVSDWSRQMFYTLIDRYYRNERQLIITSNLTLDQIATQMDDRIASRLSEMGDVMTMLPIDRRVKR